MAVIKIKKPKKNEGANESEGPKLKKIRISAGNRKEEKEPKKLKINLKKTDVKKSGSVVKLKLGSKKEEKQSRTPRLRLKPIRIPGEGYDSEASDLEDDPLIESGIILRVLPDVQVDFIKNSIESGDYTGISIKWKGERHAILKLNNVSYGAILVDLPTIIEVNKSVDRKNLFKTFDVTQMLVCVKPITSEDELFTLEAPETEDLISKHYEEYLDEINDHKVKLFKNANHVNLHSETEAKNLEKLALKKYHYKHGLTPPLYNVRNRRFRRQMHADEFEYAEKIVDMLLKADAQAEDVKFDLIAPSDVPEKGSVSAAPSHVDLSVANKPEVLNEDVTLQDDDEDLDLEEAFQSDEDESESTKRSDALFGDQDEEGGDEVEQDNGEDEDDDDDDEDDDEEEEEEEVGSVAKSGDDNEKRQHTELLADELNELVSTLEHTKDKLEKATNPLLKSRFVDSIKKLEKEVELKKKQLKESENQLSGGTGPVSSTGIVDEDDEDQDDEDDDEDEEEEEEEGEGEGEEDKDDSKEDKEEELDQNDLDMMMLFGGEGDE